MKMLNSEWIKKIVNVCLYSFEDIGLWYSSKVSRLRWIMKDSGMTLDHSILRKHDTYVVALIAYWKPKKGQKTYGESTYNLSKVCSIVNGSALKLMS